MTRLKAFAAVDLGAGSGRVIAGLWNGSTLRTEEVARFPTPYDDDGDLLRWDVRRAFASTVDGLRAVQQLCERTGATFAGIGVDSWGVDYGLVRSGEADLDDVRHHRGAGVPGGGCGGAGVAERYAITGVLDQSINTSRQLAVRVTDGSLATPATLLFIPDLWIHLLSGAIGTDPSIASTSELLDARSGGWSKQLTAELPALVLPPVYEPGTIAGETTHEVTRRIGSRHPVPVLRVAGHDTASALAFATPAEPGGSTTGLVSSGTWSLAGIAVRDPIATLRARELGFTTERNLRGHLMVRNLSGMWVVQESMRSWQSAGQPADIRELTSEAAAAASDANVIDLADPRLLEPGDMPERIAALAVEYGRYRPNSRGETVRAVLESLAAAYVAGVDDASSLAGVVARDIRIVGGGSQSPLLCQLTADRAGRSVIAGPAEASALGNLATQLWATTGLPRFDEAYATIDRSDHRQEQYRPRNAE